jgi:hypothetical protein
VEDYIVRIYRRREEEGGLFGVVEEVGIEGKKAFRSIAELVRLLQGARMKRDRGRGLRMPTRRAPSQAEGNNPWAAFLWECGRRRRVLY